MLTRKVLSVVLVAGGLVAGCSADPAATESPHVTSKEPIVVMGNPDCADVAALLGLDLGDFDLRIDPPASGRYLLDDVNHVYLAATDGVHVDWSASIGVDAVLVKGGPSTRVYLYGEEASSGAGLTAPTNPATGQPYGVSHVDVCWDYELTVRKTAETMLHRTWTWAIDKSASVAALALAPGEVARIPYRVAVSRAASDSDWGVAGVVTITNPAPFSTMVTEILDDVGELPVPVECARPLPFALAPGASATCYYHVALPDGAMRGNHVVVVTSGPVDGGEATALVDFAKATTIERDACVEVWDEHAGRLGRTCADHVYTYDLLFGPYVCGAAERVVDTARFVTVDTGARGEASWAIAVTVAPCEPGCTRTPGYWKTHAGDMAPAYDPTWKALPEGPATPFFLARASYLQVLRTEPHGNPYYVLAHAYIAAELNQLAGADGSAIARTFAQARDRLAVLLPAKVPGLPRCERELLLRLAEQLDAWNNGLIGPGHCE